MTANHQAKRKHKLQLRREDKEARRRWSERQGWLHFKAEKQKRKDLDAETKKLGLRPYQSAAINKLREKLAKERAPIVVEEVCGHLHRNGIFRCNLPPLHDGDHKETHPSGGCVGWTNDSVMQRCK